MIKNKVATVVTTGAILLSSLTPFAFADTTSASVDTGVTSPVSSLVSTVNGVAQGIFSSLGNFVGGTVGTNASVGVSSQTGASVLGNSIQTSNTVSTQLKP